MSKLYLRVKKDILDMITDGRFSDNKLPPEDELARELGVSHSTVREALLVLTKDGVISKKHGKGSFVHQSALNARMRIDSILDFITLLEDGGYATRLAQSVYGFECASVEECQSLGVEEGKQLFTFERLFYANDKVAIRALIKIPKIYMQTFPSEDEDVMTSYEFVWKYCKEDLVQSILEFLPMTAGEKEESIFAIKKGSPMISWRELFYNIKDVPISYNQIYFNPDIMKLKMLRKW